jgi:Domain of unknown function (DUF4406)
VRKTMRHPARSAKTRWRPYQDEVKILLSMTDGFVLKDREAVYASSELTSGRRFYKLCRKYKVRTKEDLNKALGSGGYRTKLLLPNIKHAVEFAREIRERSHDVVLTPNTLFVRDWTQPEYLGFWKTVIRTKCRAIVFNDGWEFSNGCTFEYLVGHKKRMRLLDRAGNSIPVGKAKQLILAAIKGLEADGFGVPELRRVSRRL